MSIRTDYKKLCEYKYTSVSDDNSQYICTYCGMPADTQDHVVPISIMAKLADLSIDIELAKIPCCRECNTLAGDIFFNSFSEKKDFIRGRLRERYQKIFNMPAWNEDELNEMGPIAKIEIKAFINKKKILLERLEYTSPTEYDLNAFFQPIKVVKQNSKLKFKTNTKYTNFDTRITIGDITRSIALWCITKNISYKSFKQLFKASGSIVDTITNSASTEPLPMIQIKILKKKQEHKVRI